MMSPSEALTGSQGALLLSRSERPVHRPDPCGSASDRAVQRHRHRRSSCWPSCTRSRPRGSPRCRTASSIATTSARAPRAGVRRRASLPSCCISSAKSKSSSACGRRAARGDDRLRRLGEGEALLQRRRELHRAALRRRHHGARVDAPDHRLRRIGAAARGQRRRRHARRVVGRDPDHRSDPRVVHHRAGGHDDLRAAAGRASSTTSSRARG